MMTGNMFTLWSSRELARGGERWVLARKSQFCDVAKVGRKTDSKFGEFCDRSTTLRCYGRY